MAWAAAEVAAAEVAAAEQAAEASPTSVVEGVVEVVEAAEGSAPPQAKPSTAAMPLPSKQAHQPQTKAAAAALRAASAPPESVEAAGPQPAAEVQPSGEKRRSGATEPGSDGFFYVNGLPTYAPPTTYAPLHAHGGTNMPMPMAAGQHPPPTADGSATLPQESYSLPRLGPEGMGPGMGPGASGMGVMMSHMPHMPQKMQPVTAADGPRQMRASRHDAGPMRPSGAGPGPGPVPAAAPGAGPPNMMPPPHLAAPQGAAGFGPSPQMGLVPGMGMPEGWLVGGDAPPPHFIQMGGGVAPMGPMPQGLQGAQGAQAMGMRGVQGRQLPPWQAPPAMVLGPMGPVGPMVGMQMQGESPHETKLLHEAFEFARVYQAAPPDPEQRELAALQCTDMVSLMLGRLLVATARYKTIP